MYDASGSRGQAAQQTGATQEQLLRFYQMQGRFPAGIKVRPLGLLHAARRLRLQAPTLTCPSPLHPSGGTMPCEVHLKLHGTSVGPGREVRGQERSSQRPGLGPRRTAGEAGRRLLLWFEREICTQDAARAGVTCRLAALGVRRARQEHKARVASWGRCSKPWTPTTASGCWACSLSSA